jgi:ADP-heptose:LPS heptosyltransferase
MREADRILVIRRDNIGDLVCTTPLLAALRTRFPKAWIGVLANSYNAPVLEGNPDIDALFAYRKLKHLGGDEGALAPLTRRIAMLWALRRKRLDLAIIAAGPQDTRGLSFARMLAPSRVLLSPGPEAGQHEVERAFSVMRELGYSGPPPPLCVIPGASPSDRIRGAIACAGLKRPLIGVHISARRAAQRWPAGRFAALIDEFHEKLGAAIVLFWSPGAEDHPQHPGDDGKAVAITAQVSNKPALLVCPTKGLPDLVAGLANCDAVVCSDGGAMHIAAALGKPIACFFGDSPVDRWRPWGVRHVVLQAASGKVEDVPVESALNAVGVLLRD